MTLGIALILSQVRAIHMFLAALKLDLTCLLPKLERNSWISLSTNYLACAAIYQKLAVEPSPRSRQEYRDMVAETKLQQSLTGLDDDEAKSKRRNLKAKLGKCKICRFGSPKYWQLVLNDIPLLVCVPFARYLDLTGMEMLTITLCCTAFDLMSMLTYLAHDEEVFVEAAQVYGRLTRRNTNREAQITAIYQAIDEADDMEAQEEALSNENDNNQQDGNGDGEDGDQARVGDINESM